MKLRETNRRYRYRVLRRRIVFKRRDRERRAIGQEEFNSLGIATRDGQMAKPFLNHLADEPAGDDIR